jgi:AcrR family transcriptional regulator
MSPVTEAEPARKEGTHRGERMLRADARRNREAVIEAAKRLFAEEGLDAQMPDVATAAKVGVGTVYRHFPAKDDLIAALAEERFRRLADRAREALAEPDAWEAFREYLRFAGEIQAEDQGLCDVMGSRPEIMSAAAFASGLDQLAAQLVRRAQETGKLRDDLEWEDVPMIACGIGQIASFKENHPAAGRWERLLAIVIDGLQAPARDPLPAPGAEPDRGPA